MRRENFRGRFGIFLLLFSVPPNDRAKNDSPNYLRVSGILFFRYGCSLRMDALTDKPLDGSGEGQNDMRGEGAVFFGQRQKNMAVLE